MKMLEAYTPAQVRACGRMVKAIQQAGGKAEDILGYAAYAERESRNPLLWKQRFVFKRLETTPPTKSEILGAYGYELVRNWLKVSKHLSTNSITPDELRSFIKSERKKDLNTTKFGKRSG